MKPKLLKIQANRVESFSARRDLSPAVNNLWHYHEELELIYIRRGEGTRFVGDNISRFKHGDLILLGSNLPHYWRFDTDYFDADQKVPDIFVVHFNANFLGTIFLEVPENRGLKKLIENSKRGLYFQHDTDNKIVDLFLDITKSEGQDRLLNLFKLLYSLSAHLKYSPIASLGFKHEYDLQEQERMQQVYQHTLNHYKRRISLEEIAGVAKMSTHAFCKFFKSRNKKNYTDFVNEIRIGHACKLLLENKLMISQICFESGFNNFSTFHKCFKQITGKSPLQYQKTFTDLA